MKIDIGWEKTIDIIINNQGFKTKRKNLRKSIKSLIKHIIKNYEKEGDTL